MLQRPLFGLFFFVSILWTACSQKEERLYHILLIHSYNDECTWKNDLNEGVKDAFKKNNVNVDIQTHYIDCDFLVAYQEIDSIQNVLNQYENTPLDLILVLDDQATYSLLATKHPFTFGVPIVFSGVDYVNDDILDGHTNITGFSTKPDFIKCCSLAHHLFPSLKEIDVIVENTYLGKKSMTEFLNQTKKIPTIVSFTDKDLYPGFETRWRDKNTGDSLFIVEKRVEWMNGKELLQNLSYRTDNICVMPKWSYSYSELPQMGTSPFFMVNNEGFGDNRLGGYMTPSYNQTFEAASVAVKILKGTPVSSFPIQQSKQIPVFNWEQLIHWKIDIDKLPSDSLIPNMPFEIRYKRHLISGGISFVALLIFLILFLTKLYRRTEKQKKAFEQNLLKQSNELDITMTSIREGVVSVDKNGLIFAINRAAIKFLSLPKTSDFYIGSNVFSVFNITDDSVPFYLKTLMTKVKEEKQSLKFSDTACLSTEKDKYFPVAGSLSPIYNEDDFYGSVITFRDLTEEYKRKKYLSMSLGTGCIYAWRYDQLSASFIYNDEFFQQIGNVEHISNKITQSNFENMIHPEERILWQKACYKIIQGEQSQARLQMRIKFDGKSYEWWEYRLSSIPTSESVFWFFGLCLNIQSFKNKENELRIARDQARQSDLLKSNFLANMSHEIRTPLNTIVGFSNLLIGTEEYTTEERKTFIATVNENCQMLLTLINDILDLSRIESGSKFEEKSCSLNDLIDEIVNGKQQLCKPDVLLLKKLPEQTLVINTDSMRLKQVLTNLVNNSIKFTEHGSILIGYKQEDSGILMIFVKDTGCGIAAEQQSLIFERFFKTDNFTQGGGLGLSVCKAIINRMEGNISLISELHKGSCFEVRIPYLKSNI